MIYTTYEMIRDCRAGNAAGWSFYEANYLPLLRRLAEHYGRELPDLRDTLFQSLEPMPERHFIAELRQRLCAAQSAESPVALELETVVQALASLTVVEKKVVWFETMRYNAADTARILRMDEMTVGKIREKSADRLRAVQDRWSCSMLEESGAQLGRKAAAQSTPQCVSAKTLLDMIDGRSTWPKREEAERHITTCWHCIDHYCRLHEVCDLLLH